MKKINLKIKKNDELQFYNDNRYYYISVNGFYVVRFHAFELFNKRTENILRDFINSNPEENKTIYEIYNNTLDKSKEIIDTKFTKRHDNEMLIFDNGNEYIYIDSNFIDFLELEYYSYYGTTKMSPVLFVNSSDSIEFIIMPIHLHDESEKYILERNEENDTN